MKDLSARRLLLVHAHPDDESINNGATMALYAATGAQVTLVTCTLGEEGEVIPPGLAHLAPDREDRLGPHRRAELAAAMKELGVADHRLLGGAGRFRDSGMMGVEQNRRERAFWRTPVDEAAGYLVEIIRSVRPQVLVTYDPDGGYGHPDHIQTHRVAVRAADLAAERAYRRDLGDPHTIDKIYWNRVPRPVAEERFAALRGVPLPGPAGALGVGAIDDVPGVVDDARITTEIDGSAHAARKAAAMRAHATQITVDGDRFVLSNLLLQPLFTTEYYELAQGVSGAPAGERERDLFAGLAGAGSSPDGGPADGRTAPGTPGASGAVGAAV
ncbi:N-acetyl-1-D-myo-inositol-2-amino-2-deoxy-alpha-D-glucopyranoside deacetylase [Streptomyces clavuligerus]|uniref:1D-myo-inositol 2-acetamido-2-deoxy-alpha-D-glucopyranoside deacetylase n=1 Tax=Streptomyces clavuligerus TaxID=1901 RepID=E2Q4Q3_STRCL|nr:N-acetyl-1-D-myo-inositol-2-amino-2-deoxy-alpha-D-glucopyranoside deacetylase [Streptomyces clavuligerus]ANW18317.1 N-acetyl-1-D-myo-inositol-2-amino-2-deoxy-alpha-D-glucopyranoside deacetylase [Streptomyces clavuligerus]AXU12875.1 N-acetyl-1-D-myo-inositol-2-amino-2-deoxy-alpha-D-glucopyranoside deacetylase [Streptomyces clavuligerus]EFG09062.1 N-acetyl-1-D-myo-inosityl-2-amino-2 [Streptomyces clavuligerus]MBY6302796.1 N-acetyl-1-D-myo-inositol-2-amino-2-deoxy-alpha-D-glucopyranoside deacet